MDGFVDIVGQRRALEFLRAVLREGQLRHAYLFTGPPGVGKMRAACDFARQLLAGTNKGGKMFNRGQHPDFFMVRRDRTRISIEEIRRLEEWLAYRPYMAIHRVVLLPEAHLLSPEAGNALLKILEEPPPYAVLVLVSDEQNILPTIMSRCQEVRFYSLPFEVVERLLLDDGVPSAKARIGAYLSRGSVGRARLLVQHPEVETAIAGIHSFLADVSARRELAILEKAEQMEKDETARLLFFGSLEMVLRDMVVYLTGGKEELLIFPENAGPAARIAGKVAELRQALEDIITLQKDYRTNVNPLLININLLFKIGRACKEG